LIITLTTSCIALILFFANLYEVIGTITTHNEHEALTDLWDYIYFSVVTFTTLGYGDYIPIGYARIVASIQSLLGLGYFAFLIGVSSSIFYSNIQKNNIG
jgi:hypothetical protein